MIWIFALGIISLMVWHPGFRKVVFWLAGLGAVGVAVMTVTLIIQDQKPVPPVVAAAPFDPDAYLEEPSKDADVNAVMAELQRKEAKTKH